VADFICNR
jgi:hypothetical protein